MSTTPARARLRVVPDAQPEPLSQHEALAAARASWEGAYDSFQRTVAHIARLHDLLTAGPIGLDIEIPQALREASALWVTADLLVSQLEEIHSARDVLIRAGGQ